MRGCRRHLQLRDLISISIGLSSGKKHTCIGKRRVRIAFDIAFSELQHEPIDLLCFSRESESLQEGPQRIDE